MDNLQLQIRELNQKVEQLYQLLEKISNQVDALATAKQQPSENSTYSLSGISQLATKSSSRDREIEAYGLAHKDILIDDNRSQHNINATKEQELSPDIQIRRLTAQLTAAYNRIAALEEQLLAGRIQS